MPEDHEWNDDGRGIGIATKPAMTAAAAIAGCCAVVLAAAAAGQAPPSETDCAALSGVVASGCAGRSHDPKNLTGAEQYLMPSGGAGSPTCSAANVAAFRRCVSAPLTAGAVVELADQSWSAPGGFTITGFGTAAAPVTIRARHQGGVKIVGPANFSIRGTYVRFEGFAFAEPETANAYSTAIALGYGERDQCRHCLAASNTFSDYDHSDGSMFTPLFAFGEWNRIAYNAVDGKHSISGTVIVDNLPGDPPDHTRIDHNYLANRPPGGSGSGYETIIVGNDWETGQSPPYRPFRRSDCVIDDNLFYKVHGSVNVVSLKGGGCSVRNNTFRDVGDVAVSMRLSDANIVEGNIVDGAGAAATGGVLLRGDGHIVVHNIFQRLSPRGPSGDEVWAVPVAVYAGDPEWRDNRDLYKPATNATIAFNVFADSDPLSLGEWVVGSPAVNTGSGKIIEPTGIRFVDNLVASDTNIRVLAAAADSEVATAGNLCSRSISDKVCGGAGSVTLAGELYRPAEPGNPTVVPSHAAYATLGLPDAALARLFYVTQHAGRPISYHYLQPSDVGPQKW